MPASIRLGVLLLAAFGRVLPGQAISVSVRDTTGAALSQVSLVLQDTSGRTIATARTGTRGIALMPRADTGLLRVLARRFGFTPARSDVVHVGPTDTVAIRLTLVRGALVMDPVVIFAQRDSVRRDVNPFGINLRATGGHIVTPAEIEYSIMGARDVADVLARRAIPGLTIDQRRRCIRSTRAAGCLPFVIDGQLFPDGSAMQDVVVPEVIDYMVVLRGSEVGVRYGSIGHNGIILIATKRDWRRLRR